MPATTKKTIRNSLHYHLDIDGDDIVKDVNKPFMYTMSVPGKDVRNKLVDVFQYWTDVPAYKLTAIKEISHNVHNMSLILDDIQDSSYLRRGVPSAYTIYGVPRIVVGGLWMEALCFQFLDEQQNDEFTRTMLHIFRQGFAGQGMELYWRENQICPTQAEYFQAVYKKTCALFAFIPTIMNTLTESKPIDGTRFLTAFGIYFQLTDDYLNLRSDLYTESKGFADDISEGKFSFPILHAVNNFPKEAIEIKKIMKLHTHDVEIKKRCLAILEECGSFEHTRNVLKELKTVINDEIAKFPPNPLVDDFITKSFHYII